MLSIDDNNELLYIKRSNQAHHNLKSIAVTESKNLTELEYKYVICPKCEGIM